MPVDENKTTDELQQHMIWTYYGLRYALMFIGFLLPPAVWATGKYLHDTTLRDSISAYYYVTPVVAYLGPRDIFVGGLITAAFCLYAYKGFSNRENYLLNTAAVCALGVALVPSTVPGGTPTFYNKVHTVSAIAFFAFLALVSWFCANDTVHLIPKERRRFFGSVYAIIGTLMLGVAARGIYLALNEASRQGAAVFWLEASGMWVFGSYWLFKTSEMRSSDAERMALDAQLERTKKNDPDVPDLRKGKMKVLAK